MTEHACFVQRYIALVDILLPIWRIPLQFVCQEVTIYEPVSNWWQLIWLLSLARIQWLRRIWWGGTNREPGLWRCTIDTWIFVMEDFEIWFRRLIRFKSRWCRKLGTCSVSRNKLRVLYIAVEYQIKNIERPIFVRTQHKSSAPAFVQHTSVFLPLLAIHTYLGEIEFC